MRHRPIATSSPKLFEPNPREDPRSTTVRDLGVKRQALAPAGPGLRRAVRVTDQRIPVDGVNNKVVGDDELIQGSPWLALDRGPDAGEDGGDELGDTIAAPRVEALAKGTKGGGTIPPNGKVEGEEEGGERGRDVDEKGAGEREGKAVRNLREGEEAERDQRI